MVKYCSIHLRGNKMTDTLIAPTFTARERWDKASRVLRKNGIQFRFNVQKCCRSCITEADLGMKSDDQPYGFTYGGQGNRVIWVNGEPTEDRGKDWRGHRRLNPLHTIYINFGNGGGHRIAETFREFGFEVEWDGSDNRCIEIKF